MDEEQLEGGDEEGKKKKKKKSLQCTNFLKVGICVRRPRPA